METCNILIQLALVVLLIIAAKHNRFVYVICKTFKRDVRAAIKLWKVVRFLKKIKSQNKPIYHYFNETVNKYPHKTAFIFEDEHWSFSDVRDLSNKIAVYFEKEGYKKGDSIALLLNNCPEYISVCLGLSRIGVTVALVNTNHVNASLLHSLKLVSCKAIIFGAHFKDSVTTCIMPNLNIKCYQYNRKSDGSTIAGKCVNLTADIFNIKPYETLKGHYNIIVSDHLYYIYTSGTTGLPKSVIVTHMKISIVGSMSTAVLKKPEDAIVYCPMPLYHGSGIAFGCGQAIFWGATVVMRTKFSASNYWSDCVKYNCNVGQYIGEMCRYILRNCPQNNIQHPVKVMVGVGLKSQIWKEFQDKYKIKEIVEFYSCSEANFGLVNLDGKIGSIGFIPPYLRKYATLQLVKYSDVTNKPIRDEMGFCIKVKENEPGLAIGLIGKASNQSATYVGYRDAYETNKIILRDVFEKGDRYYVSSDVFCYDEFGWYTFVDRMGDTFRWKGENVSTSEIESIISNSIGFNDAVCYGVQIPGNDGKVGMIAIAQDHRSVDIDVFRRKLKSNLSSYAMPMFIRFTGSLPLTSTYKFQKHQLKSEGFDLNVTNDRIYFHNAILGKYVPLTTQIYEEISNGEMRL